MRNVDPGYAKTVDWKSQQFGITHDRQLPLRFANLRVYALPSPTIASLALGQPMSLRRSIAKRSQNLVAALTAGLAGLGTLAFPMSSYAIEEPEYKVVRQLEGIEVREYAPFTVAEVVVAGSNGDAGNRAFPILAGYIFGKNKGDRKLAMTAPVTQSAVPVKLEMTAPVTQTTTPGGFLVQFVLPRGVTVANAPEPLDARVMLREVPSSQVAVIKYSGFWSESNYNEHLAKLHAAMKAAELTWTGEPILSRYNGPTTPWFMRRNEIWLHLSKAP